MDVFTITLMLSAGLLHASWHSLVKSANDGLANMAGMGAVAAIPALLWLMATRPLPSAAVWAVLAASVCLHVGYKVCLARAYMRADLGEAFPMARGTVPLFATAIAFVGLGQVPTAPQRGAILLICVSLLLLAYERLRGGFSIALFGAIAGAGLAVAFYSVLDSYGTHLSGNWIDFTAWLIVLDTSAFLLVARAMRGPQLWSTMATISRRIATSGALGLLSFGVFMWALSRNPVGPVSALRETSVLFSILIGVVFHRERLSGRRIVAAVLIIGGVAILAASE
ncbi:MAG: EamA family transporter [Proteobacteria bacterium]|nr:EamA family transporter [Pseudomonadota bacterium]